MSAGGVKACKSLLPFWVTPHSNLITHKHTKHMLLNWLGLADYIIFTGLSHTPSHGPHNNSEFKYLVLQIMGLCCNCKPLNKSRKDPQIIETSSEFRSGHTKVITWWWTQAQTNTKSYSSFWIFSSFDCRLYSLCRICIKTVNLHYSK